MSAIITRGYEDMKGAKLTIRENPGETFVTIKITKGKIDLSESDLDKLSNVLVFFRNRLSYARTAKKIKDAGK